LCFVGLSRQSDSVRGKLAPVKKDAVKTSASASLAPAAAAAVVAVPPVVDEQEMNTLLSQYLPRPAISNATGR